MKLRDFFSTTVAGSETVNSMTEGSEGLSEAAKYKLQQQIKALMPGQTLLGKIVGKENTQVQIQLASDIILNAALESEIPIEPGKMMTFQVKNNGKNLTLSPLFANMATDENVMKALDMAGIPVTDRTILMTESMMKEGMSVDKQSLQVMFKVINSFPEAAPEQIVQLQKLGIPVTETNLEQAENYQHLTHQIGTGLQALTEELAAFVEVGYEQGNIAESNQLLAAIVKAVFAKDEGVILSNQGTVAESLPGETAIETPIGTLGTPAEAMTESTTESPAGKLEGNLAEGNKVPGDRKETVQNLLEQLQGLQENEGMGQKLSGKIFRELGKELVSLIQKELQEQFSVKPEEVSKPKAIQELYERIQRQLSALEEAVSHTAGKESSLMKGTQQMQNNLDFMHQLNQAFQFVQLPLKMNERGAHGDLYVYTNKKNLAQKEGSVSAFLHLDMERLGSVDIYVTMEEQKVGTRFFVKDDDILSFLYAHMELLDERLQKRGYTLSYEMKVQEEKDKAGVLDHILSQERTVNILAQHAFDVRA